MINYEKYSTDIGIDWCGLVSDSTSMSVGMYLEFVYMHNNTTMYYIVVLLSTIHFTSVSHLLQKHIQKAMLEDRQFNANNISSLVVCSRDL